MPLTVDRDDNRGPLGTYSVDYKSAASWAQNSTGWRSFRRLRPVSRVACRARVQFAVIVAVGLIVCASVWLLLTKSPVV